MIGNGPSLRDVDLTLLAKESTFTCNGAYLHDFGFQPTYYGINKTKLYHVNPVTNAWPNTYKFFLTKSKPDFLPASWTWKSAYLGKSMHQAGFSPLLPVLPVSQATPLTLAQIAWLLGYREFYFVGNDQTRYGHSYALNGPLAERRKGGGLGDLLTEDEWAKTEDGTEEDFKRARRDIETLGGAIYECTPDGKMAGVLPYMPLKEVLHATV